MRQEHAMPEKPDIHSRMPAWFRADPHVLGCWVNRLNWRLFRAAAICWRLDKWNEAKQKVTK